MYVSWSKIQSKRFQGDSVLLRKGNIMKRLIKAATATNVDRITIDFYGGIDLTEIEAASNPKIGLL